MGYNHDYERAKCKWTHGQHFINNVMWIIITPVIITLLPVAALWNYGDPLRRKKHVG